MAFDTSVSGILSASADLGIIGNNIANASTTGFKQSRAEFTDIYATSLLGTAGTSIGQGVKLNSVTQDFAQGNIEFTNNSLDLAINGNGFFRMSDEGVATYTRAGSFQLDRDGFLVNSSNMRLQGFPIDEAGNITGELGDIQLSTQLIDPKATTAVSITSNLDSREAEPSVAWPTLAEKQADATKIFSPFGTTANAPAPTQFNSSTSLTVYDGFGNPHVLAMYFVKTDTANTWEVKVAIDGVEQDGEAADGSIASGLTTLANNQTTLQFQNNGKVDTSATGPYLGAAELTITGWTPLDANGDPNGAAAQNFTIDLSTFTQFGADFAVGSIQQDGYSTGQLRGLEIDSTGVLFTRYTNGQSRQQNQIALAGFTNPNGLQPAGDTNFVETFAAGQPTITTPGLSGTGALQSGALEASNVEITSQLVKMIIAQRNFQANAQMIQTEDAVTQTVINLR